MGTWLIGKRIDNQPQLQFNKRLVVTSNFFNGLDRWVGLAGDAAGQPWLLYGGERRYKRSDTEVVPWRLVDELAARVAPR